MIPDIDTLVSTRSAGAAPRRTVLPPAADLWTGPRLVGFCGPAGSGKSTAAEHLVAGYGFRRLRFAGPLKAMMRAIGLTEREVDGDLKERPCPLLCGRTPRQAMQWLGTEWGREMIGRGLWIEAWARDQAAAALLDIPVVVDDVRFADEVAAIRARHGLVVRIDRPGVVAASAHVSEALDFAVDATIANAADVAALERAVERFAGL